MLSGPFLQTHVCFLLFLLLHFCCLFFFLHSLFFFSPGPGNTRCRITRWRIITWGCAAKGQSADRAAVAVAAEEAEGDSGAKAASSLRSSSSKEAADRSRATRSEATKEEGTAAVISRRSRSDKLLLCPSHCSTKAIQRSLPPLFYFLPSRFRSSILDSRAACACGSRGVQSEKSDDERRLYCMSMRKRNKEHECTNSD